MNSEVQVHVGLGHSHHRSSVRAPPGTLHQRHKELLQQHDARQRIGQMFNRNVGDFGAHASGAFEPIENEVTWPTKIGSVRSVGSVEKRRKKPTNIS